MTGPLRRGSRGGEMGEFPPPPFSEPPFFPFFLYPSNTSTRLWFFYIITKIHTPFQNPGSAPASVHSIDSLQTSFFTCGISKWFPLQDNHVGVFTLKRDFMDYALRCGVAENHLSSQVEVSACISNFFIFLQQDEQTLRILSGRKAKHVFQYFFIFLQHGKQTLRTLSDRKAKQLSNPWITHGLKKSIRIKNRLYWPL